MAVTDDDFAQLRAEIDARLNAVSLDLMGALTALSDHNDRFNRVHARFDAVDKRLDHMDDRFDRIDDRFDAVDRRMDRMDDRFDRIDDRFDRIDTRFDFLDQKFDRKIELLGNKLDTRFGWQTAMMAGLGVVTVFAEPIRSALGF